MPGFDPSDWLDLLAYAIVAVPPTVTAFAAWRKAKDAHYEVTNDHKSNIRHDIDDLSRSVREGFANVDRQLEGIREDLRAERDARIAADNLLAEELADNCQ